MAKKGLGLFGRITLRFFLPVGIAFACFITAVKLLQPAPTVVQGASVVFSIIVMGYSIFMAQSEARRWDEVQRAGAGFANSNGWVWGGFATLILLEVPAIMHGAVGVVLGLRASGPTDVHLGVQLGLTFGATLVMVMQALAICVASVIWGLRMRGPAA